MSVLPDESIENGMKRALELAQEAARLGEVPVGAVIIRKEGPLEQVIGEGYNLREDLQDPLAHAEMIAIREAAQKLGTWRLNNCYLVVTLEPCPMCLGAIQQARLSTVFYGAKDPKGGAISLGYLLNEDKRTHHRFPVLYRETTECSQILKNFFESLRR